MIRLLVISIFLAAAGILLEGHPIEAGMPASLPTSWVMESPNLYGRDGAAKSGGEAEWQAISFFLAVILICGWGTQKLWSNVRRDFPDLPELKYGRATSLVLLWGFCGIIVLTMISGARELMTPGAWKKQGATYALAGAEPNNTVEERLADRRASLERLRFSLWNFAATHQGRMPEKASSEILPELWEIKGEPGLKFLYLEGKSVGKEGKVLAFEPEIDPDQRLVLLTNGMIGTMRTSELEPLLQDKQTLEPVVSP